MWRAQHTCNTCLLTMNIEMKTTSQNYNKMETANHIILLVFRGAEKKIHHFSYVYKDTSPAGKKSNLTLNFKTDFVCVLSPGNKLFFIFLVFVLCSMPISSACHLSVQKSFCLRLIAFSFGQVRKLCSVVIKNVQFPVL